MSEKRRTGLGKGLAALIPQAPGASRPVDVFFPDGEGAKVERASVEMRESVDVEDGRLAESHLEATDRSIPSESPEQSDNSNDSTGLVDVPARYEEVPLGLIVPNPSQPRTVFDEEDLAETCRLDP